MPIGGRIFSLIIGGIAGGAMTAMFGWIAFGSGGGAVLRALWRSLMPGSVKQRFVRDAQAASAAAHPNICTVHGIESTPDDQLFIVMAYCEGQTLKERLEKGALPIDEAIWIATQVADGLAKAHAMGVVHRD